MCFNLALNRKLLEKIVFLGPSLILLTITFIYPLWYCFNSSFSFFYLPNPPPKFVGFDNFAKLLNDHIFWNSVLISLYITLVAVSLQFVLGFFIALLLDNIIHRGRGVILKFLLTPMLIPPVVAGLIMRWMFLRDWGMVNYFLSILGVSKISWLAQQPYAFISVVLADVWQWTPFMILVFFSGLQSLPEAPIEAARIDGSSSIQLLRYIILPLLKPLIVFTIIIRSMDVFRIFDKIFVMTGGGPVISTEAITVYNHRLTFWELQIGLGSALAILTMLMLLIGIGLFLYFFYRGERGEW